ncbi:MAG: DUF72 domain-containing protein [Acidobacteriota bacterium]
MSQLSLFETEAPDDGYASEVEASHAEARTLAAALPATLYFGTSSWSFPGWAGLVYRARRSATALARNGLSEYARHPLLRTVGIDRSYYAPIPVDDLRHYAAQLPPGFRCCAKVPASVTAYAHRSAGRSELNPGFLSLERLHADVLEPFAVAFRDHTGPFILEFPPFPRDLSLEPAAFADRLGRFLAGVPRDFEYAVEIRDRRLLTSAYLAVIREHGVAHTFNYWSAMPMPAEQAEVVAPEQMPFAVVRLLLRPGTWYEDQRDRFQPFNRLVEPDEAMRADVVDVVGRALRRGGRAYVLVNNKAEGSSPLTVMALARRLAAAL